MLIGDVDKDAVVGLVELEGFGVRRELDFDGWVGLPWDVEKEVGGRVGRRGLAALGDRQERSEGDGCEGAGARLATGADEDELGSLVEADVIGVAAKVGPRAFGIGAGVEGAAGAIAAAANEEAALAGEKEEALGLVNAGQAVNAAAFGEVYDFDRVVLQGGDEELARGKVNGQVIEPSFDAFEGNRPDKGERAGLLGGSGREAGRGQEQGQSREHLHVFATVFRHAGEL